MNRKLTLKLDGTVIDRAKEYAEINHDSVSGLVERYLKTLTSRNPQENDAHGLQNKSSMVREVSGIITLPPAYSEREDFRQSKAKRYNG